MQAGADRRALCPPGVLRRGFVLCPPGVLRRGFVLCPPGELLDKAARQERCILTRFAYLVAIEEARTARYGLRCQLFASPWTKIAKIGDFGGIRRGKLPMSENEPSRNPRWKRCGAWGLCESRANSLAKIPISAIFVHCGADFWHRVACRPSRARPLSHCPAQLRLCVSVDAFEA